MQKNKWETPVNHKLTHIFYTVLHVWYTARKLTLFWNRALLCVTDLWGLCGIHCVTYTDCTLRTHCTSTDFISVRVLVRNYQLIMRLIKPRICKCFIYFFTFIRYFLLLANGWISNHNACLLMHEPLTRGFWIKQIWQIPSCCRCTIICLPLIHQSI